MDRLQRLRKVSEAYEVIKPDNSNPVKVSEEDLLDYIESIKKYLSRLHSGFLAVLEES